MLLARFFVFFSFLCILCFSVPQTYAQSHSHAVGATISFPSVPGFEVLKCDFHQHSVFSDGNVWPTIRVLEALMEGLDAISLTEHLEYQPHKQDIPNPNRNRSYELALAEAKNHKLLIVNGSEITRSMPPGHNNAIFLSDANLLLTTSPLDAFKEAKKQGAFVFWNHPNWISQKKDGIASLTDFHRQLINDSLLQGIEIVNEHTYSEEAFQLALDHNLTLMGTSDIHGIVGWEFGNDRDFHRPITLVLAKNRSVESIKEALLDRRTVVFFKNLLIGRSQHILPLLKEIVTVQDAQYINNSFVLKVTLKNNSSCPMLLKNNTNYTFHSSADIISIPADSEIQVEIKTRSKLDTFNLSFQVLNAITAPSINPVIHWDMPLN